VAADSVGKFRRFDSRCKLMILKDSVPRSEGTIARGALAGHCRVCSCVVTHLYVVTTMSLNIRSEEAEELDEIALHCSTLPVRDPRSADEIMGLLTNP
jgi:hypothetical protein